MARDEFEQKRSKIISMFFISHIVAMINSVSHRKAPGLSSGLESDEVLQ